MFSRQQILYSIISDGHRMLDQGLMDDRLAHEYIRHTLLFNSGSSCEQHTYSSPSRPTNRDDFSVKLALLSNQWQCIVRRAQQRRGIIDSLVRQWHNYREMAEKLQRWLQEVTHDSDVQPPGEAVALQQARNLLDQIQVGYRDKEEL